MSSNIFYFIESNIWEQFYINKWICDWFDCVIFSFLNFGKILFQILIWFSWIWQIKLVHNLFCSVKCVKCSKSNHKWKSIDEYVRSWHCIFSKCMYCTIGRLLHAPSIDIVLLNSNIVCCVKFVQSLHLKIT